MFRFSLKTKLYILFLILIVLGCSAFFAFALDRDVTRSMSSVNDSPGVVAAETAAGVAAAPKKMVAEDSVTAMGAAIEELDRAISAADESREAAVLTSPLALVLYSLVILALVVVLVRFLNSRKKEHVEEDPRTRSSITFDSRVLSKGQDACVEFMNIFYADPLPSYESISPLLDSELREKFTSDKYGEFLKKAKEMFGEMVEVKFIAFERMDAFDQLTYFSRFSKENTVVIRMGFSKRGRIVYFRLEPYNKKEDTPLLNK